MSALNHKPRRDLLALKGQAIAIALVIACGVATLVMSLSVVTSLRTTFYATTTTTTSPTSPRDSSAPPTPSPPTSPISPASPTSRPASQSPSFCSPGGVAAAASGTVVEAARDLDHDSIHGAPGEERVEVAGAGGDGAELVRGVVGLIPAGQAPGFAEIDCENELRGPPGQKSSCGTAGHHRPRP